MIKVRTKSNEEEYILLGAGYGMFNTAGRSIWSAKDGEERVVALCNKKGVIFWAKSVDVYVVEVDGIPVGEHFE